MVKLVEFDEKVTLAQQMDEGVGPVILLNKFNVNPEEVDQFLKVFAATTEIMKEAGYHILRTMDACMIPLYNPSSLKRFCNKF